MEGSCKGGQGPRLYGMPLTALEQITLRVAVGCGFIAPNGCHTASVAEGKENYTYPAFMDVQWCNILC